jgi:hypothetical protein
LPHSQVATWSNSSSFFFSLGVIIDSILFSLLRSSNGIFFCKMSQKSDRTHHTHSIRHRRFFGDDRALPSHAVGPSGALSTDPTHSHTLKGPTRIRSRSVDHVLGGKDDIEIEQARHRAKKRLHEDAVQGLQAALAVAASASRENRTQPVDKPVGKGMAKTRKQRRSSDLDARKETFLGKREEGFDPDGDAEEKDSGEDDSVPLPARPEDQKVVVLGGVRSRPPRRGFHGRRKAAFIARNEKEKRSVLPNDGKEVEEVEEVEDGREEKKKEVVVRLEHLMIESEEVERVREDVARFDHVRLERATKQSEELWKNLLHRDMIESRSVASAHRMRRMSDGGTELEKRHLTDREKELEKRERELDAWEKDLRARETILQKHF